MKSYVVDSLTFAIESGTLRRWECWLLRRIRERMIREAMRFSNLSREDTA